MQKYHAIFLINLLQDINILRPLIYMAARDLGFYTELLLTREFTERDKQGSWQRELSEIGTATGALVITVNNHIEAFQLLQSKTGLLIAGSESNLSAHAPTHQIFQIAPASFLKVTLQHGFECVGFRQSREHDLAHGTDVSFAADVLCGWCESPGLTSMLPSQRPKLYVTGPSTILQMRGTTAEVAAKTGLVCENMHSVRLNATGNHKAEFITVFNEFCKAEEDRGRQVTLRPHPGGQFVLKNKLALLPNVSLNNHPVYKVNLKNYCWGISAPSSVLIDMVLAGIPVAVWRDQTGVMDADNYAGLTEVSTGSDWIDFSREAELHPARYLDKQKAFLESRLMLTNPADIYDRFARLFLGVTAPGLQDRNLATQKQQRILFVAAAMDATLQGCLISPLQEMIDSADIFVEIITEQQMLKQLHDKPGEHDATRWIARRFSRFMPTQLVFCRYGGQHAEYMVRVARSRGIPVIYHIDDDLLNVPEDLGRKKHSHHNNPARLATVRYLLENADIVYCSTEYLKQQFLSYGVKSRLVSGAINFSGTIIAQAILRPVCKVGYMGFDKSYELERILPAVVTYLREYPQVEFHLFGTFTLPLALDEFSARVRLYAPIRNYDEFLQVLAGLEWDIGICPLAVTPFNKNKSNVKWVEYTVAGAAVIASKDTVYDDCCADGCGILVESNDDWLTALKQLTDHPEARYKQILRAQARLEREYSVERHRKQVLEIIAEAGKTPAGKN